MASAGRALVAEKPAQSVKFRALRSSGVSGKRRLARLLRRLMDAFLFWDAKGVTGERRTVGGRRRRQEAVVVTSPLPGRAVSLSGAAWGCGGSSFQGCPPEVTGGE